MHCTRKICENVYWIGGNDRRLAMFEGVYSVPKGVSYNSYVILDEKIAVCDTVDAAVSRVYFENLAQVLGDRTPDYLIVHHMEPDHAATIDDFVRRYPEVKIVCNAKILGMIKQFFDFDADIRAHVVNEGDTLSLGERTLTFINAPMVHWPEVMMSYESHDKMLFTADAFGCFGALNGAIFADEVDFDRDYLDEARRYYTNIVGKYGTQVVNALKKASALDIKYVCPLHGFVWRENIGYFIDKYLKWATYTPERNGVMIAYASVYGNTANAAEILSTALRTKGIETVMFDVSVTPASEIIAAAFKYSHAVFASTTYNAGIFVTMEELLRDIAAHNIQNRTVAFIQNGSWAPSSAKQMKEIMATVKNTTLIESVVDVRSSVKQATLESIYALADEIAATLPQKTEVKRGEVDVQSLNSISYGLFALFTNDGAKDNACIINTAMQVTVNPLRVAVCVNKDNYTCQTLRKTGLFNISVLDESASFDIFKRFGFQSGKDTDKLAGFDDVRESANGLKYLCDMSCAYISGKVMSEVDLGTHVMFIADVTEAQSISGVAPVTYAYYHMNIKQKPANVPEKSTAKTQVVGWSCKICGHYVEGEILAEDYICPICKHPASDFEPVEVELKEVAPNTEQHEKEKKIIGWSCKICGYFYEGEQLPDDFVCPLCKHPASDFEPVYG
ncbi:MAG: MBL fold metallo-hydrolase [Ruminococcaceae bacterium]|nr:MBL fold metallo-hydrolase [Oscillospiraceae bacterium]